MIICLAFNYKRHTVSLQMRLIYDQRPLKSLLILGVFATRKMSQKSERETEGKDAYHKQHPPAATTTPEEPISSCHTHLSGRQL